MIFTPQTKATKALSYVITLILFIALITVLGMFGGCKSAEKRQAKMYGKFDKLKRKADADSVLKVVPPKWSLDKFPVTVGKGKTTFLPGRTITKHDTITDTKTVKDTVYVTKYVTKHHYQTDTFATTDTIVDNRPLSQLQHELRQVNDKLIQSTEREKQAVETKNKQRNKMLWSMAVNLLFILLIIAYILRRFGIIR